MSQFLQRAIDLAITNVAQGGTPYGAVVVKDGEIIGEGVNTIHGIADISGHAELNAIRQAQALLGRTDLSDCSIYASGHPCPMCFGAIGMSNMTHVVYANSLEEAKAVGMGRSLEIYKYLQGDARAIEIDVIHEPIDEANPNPMQIWGNKHPLNQ